MRTLVPFAADSTAIERLTELDTLVTQWHGIVSKKSVEPETPPKPWLVNYPPEICRAGTGYGYRDSWLSIRRHADERL